MRLRPARLDDAESLARVHLQSWREAYPGIIADSFLKNLSLADRVKGWRANLSPDYEGGRFTFVAEDPKSGVVGFSSGDAQRDESLKAAYDGELLALYLLKDFQKQGIGKALFQQVASRLREKGFQGMTTWVLKENPSRGFYKKMGGSELAHKKIMIDREHDEVAYCWEKL